MEIQGEGGRRVPEKKKAALRGRSAGKGGRELAEREQEFVQLLVIERQEKTMGERGDEGKRRETLYVIFGASRVARIFLPKEGAKAGR